MLRRCKDFNSYFCNSTIRTFILCSISNVLCCLGSHCRTRVAIALFVALSSEMTAGSKMCP